MRRSLNKPVGPECGLLQQPVRCEVLAVSQDAANALRSVVRDCAAELGHDVVISARAPEPFQGFATVTLQLSTEAALEAPWVWSLTCRLASFCGDARVSVLVRCSETVWRPEPRRPRLALSA